MNVPVKGDKYEWHGISITVVEVSPDGLWAMIHCEVTRQNTIPRPGNPGTYIQEWDKQQPVIRGKFPDDWHKVEGLCVVTRIGQRSLETRSPSG